MDLKTYLFINGIPMRQFARIMGYEKHTARYIVVRQLRPGWLRANQISYATGGMVTVDELINPQKYPVSWVGDKCRYDYKRCIAEKELPEGWQKSVTPLTGSKRTPPQPKRGRPYGREDKRNRKARKENIKVVKEPGKDG